MFPIQRYTIHAVYVFFYVLYIIRKGIPFSVYLCFYIIYIPSLLFHYVHFFFIFRPPHRASQDAPHEVNVTLESTLPPYIVDDTVIVNILLSETEAARTAGSSIVRQP